MASDTTIQYVVGMAGLTALGISSMVIGGSVAQVIAVAVAGAFGFHLGTHGKASPSPASAPDLSINGPKVV
jgi:hypothetical protein